MVASAGAKVVSDRTGIPIKPGDGVVFDAGARDIENVLMKQVTGTLAEWALE